MSEAPGRAILGQLREADYRNRTLLNRLWSAMVVHIGGGVTGAGRVDLDPGLAQVIREGHGEHIQRRFGSVIAEDLRMVERRAGIAIDRERAERA